MKIVILLTTYSLLLTSSNWAQNMTIQLTSPAKNTRYPVCSDIKLVADAGVQNGEIKRVEFYMNGRLFKAVRSAPYEVIRSATPDGIYEIVATAVDGNDVKTSTEPILVYVGNVKDGNVIINGEFNCDPAPWFLDNYVNAQSTVTMVPDLYLTDDSSGVVVDIQNQGDEFWAVQLMQPFQIEEGHTYEVTFWARADEPKEIDVDISKNYDDYAPLHHADFTIEDLDLYGPFVFTAEADDDNLMFKFVLGGNTIPIEIDAVQCIDQQWTAVSTPEQQVHSLVLNQNYPNPFNPTTTITYSLENSGPITLSIYNLKGELVTSFSAEKPAGTHSYIWAGRTSTGVQSPSGLYLYRLETSHGSLVRKMFLLR